MRFSADPAAGKEVGKIIKIFNVIVSAGNEKVKMPDYVGIFFKEMCRDRKGRQYTDRNFRK